MNTYSVRIEARGTVVFHQYTAPSRRVAIQRGIRWALDNGDCEPMDVIVDVTRVSPPVPTPHRRAPSADYSSRSGLGSNRDKGLSPDASLA